MMPAAIERAAAAAWPASDVEERGGWLLRHTPRLARARSNAALPLAAEPDVAVVEAWYGARGAAALVQVAPLEEHATLDAALVAAGWQALVRVDVLVAAAGELAAPGRLVTVLGSATSEWLGAWARAEGRDDAAVHDELVFSCLPPGRAAYALSPDGSCVGMAILTGGGACGLFCMATRPDARRQGLATVVLAGLAEWARDAGAGTVYLQVLESNAGAKALYARAGFRRSHGYVHRTAPTRSAPAA